VRNSAKPITSLVISIAPIEVQRYQSDFGAMDWDRQEKPRGRDNFFARESRSDEC
jgi:hypothetical protein